MAGNHSFYVFVFQIAQETQQRTGSTASISVDDRRQTPTASAAADCINSDPIEGGMDRRGPSSVVVGQKAYSGDKRDGTADTGLMGGKTLLGLLATDGVKP